MTADATALGKRIRERRAALGLSQKDLADAGISPSYVSLIESGKRWPTLDVLEILADRLQTTSEALTTGNEPAPARSSDGIERVDLELRWAKIALRAGDAAAAERSARAGLEDPACTVAQRHDGLLVLAGAAEIQGQVERAIDILEPLLEELDADTTRELWQSCQVMLCRCYREVGDLAHAIELGEIALNSEAVMTDDQIALAITLASAYQWRGDVKRAGRLLTRILGRAEVAGSHRNQGAALWNASLVADAEGRLDDAVRLSQRALALFSEGDAVRNLGRLRVSYGTFLREESASSVPLARDQLNRALEDFESEGSVIERAVCLTELARCALDEDDLHEAEALIMRAGLEIPETEVAERAYVDLVRGHVMVRTGRVDEGLLVAHRAALALEDHADSTRDAARAWRELATLAESTGRHKIMVGALERAVDVLGVRPTRVRTAPSRSGLEQHAGLEHRSGLEHRADLEQHAGLEHRSGLEHRADLEQHAGLEHRAGLEQAHFAPVER